MRNITFQNTNSTNPTTAATTVRFVLTDGGSATSATSANVGRHGDGEPDQQYTVVNRVELGDLPENTVNTAPQVIDNVSFNDADGSDFNGGSVRAFFFLRRRSARDQLGVRSVEEPIRQNRHQWQHRELRRRHRYDQRHQQRRRRGSVDGLSIIRRGCGEI
ncbi:MAG: hypothetical protein R2856_08040 [Caldilineaceae bacterium]